MATPPSCEASSPWEREPVMETSRNALALLQTVVMSFGRNQYLGKPDLPINHVHVYFPVQVVHKLVERCCALRLQDVTPQEGNGIST